MPLQVVAGLYGPDGARLPISAAEVDTLGGTAAVLTGLSLMPPAPVPPPPLARPLEIRAADQIALIATSLPADDALASGDEAIELQINWEALAHPARAYTLFLHLVDDSGGLAAQYDGPPVAGFATDAWPPGSRWSGRYAIAPELCCRRSRAFPA